MNTDLRFDELSTIAAALKEAGGHAVLVGGAVRDLLLGYTPKDLDVEVFGLRDADRLIEILRRFGSVHDVGKSFGVLKLRTETDEYDFSFPRKEKKVGKGHRGFKVTPDGSMDFSEAARRRDFTVNALGYDLSTHEILDPYGGLHDLQYRTLRHIDDTTFIEDPLRVYRAVQFAARFEMDVAPDTARLCRRMVEEGMLDELPKERVYEEFKKLLLKAPRPSVGFELMRAWGITERYFPDLHALVGVPQDKRYHPEGDVWVHTMMVVDAMARLLREETVSTKAKLVYMFAALCHDLGKPDTTTIETPQGERIPWREATPKRIATAVRIRALGHERAGLEPTRRLIRSLTNEKELLSRVLPLVEHHLKPSQFYHGKAKDAAIRRLALHVPIDDLVRVAKADFLGRTTPEARAGRFEAGAWLLERAEALRVKEGRPDPLLKGRDLIALGLPPSKAFSSILNEVYERQLDGDITTEKEARELALRLAKSQTS